MLLAGATGVYWYFADPGAMWLVLTSVLMVACPCALALAAPFTYGNMLRVFGRHGLYLKNADVIERMASINTVVFDKTGTVTHGDSPEVIFHGELSQEARGWVKCLTESSTHPLSVLITSSIKVNAAGGLSGFREIPGKGLEGVFNGHTVRVGAASFVGSALFMDTGRPVVFVSVDERVQGFFEVKTSVREGMSAMLARLGGFTLALLSGDNAAGKDTMLQLFGPTAEMLFAQSPHDKLAFVRELQDKGQRVMMVGDGLNDSGALRQSDVGIAVTDSTGVFTPASDGILTGSQVANLDRFIILAKSARRVLLGAFLVSFFYNAIALGFAVTGHLTPLVAAVLMPVSSFSVIAFSILGVRYAASRVPLAVDSKTV
jgi:Cu+-exporting ATPase